MVQPSIFGLLEALDSSYIDVRQTRCVQVRNKNAMCMKCACACTSGCISYNDNQLVINQELCIGCGTCATVCPTCALEARHPSDASLYAQCLAASKAACGSAVITCERLFRAAQGLADPEKLAVVTCLGRVEESLIVRLAAAGAHDIALVEGPCGECEHAKGEACARSVCDTANTLLEAWGHDKCARILDVLPTEVCKQGGAGNVRAQVGSALDGDAGAARKSLRDGAGVEGAASSSAGGANGSVVAAGALSAVPVATAKAPHEPSCYLKVMDDGTLPHFIPDRRERLLDALAQIGQPARNATISTRLWGHVSIDASLCSSCRMCATFCPTGAIEKFEEEDGAIGVSHRAGDCVKCRCCENICPEGAITIDDAVDVEAVVHGSSERHVMPLRTKVPGGSHSILSYMKDLIDTNQIYER